MKKILLWAILGAWLGSMALAGCGQTGPLYLPKPVDTTKQLEAAQAAQVRSLAAPNGSMASPANSLAAPSQSLAAPGKSLVPSQKSVNPTPQ